MIDSGVDLSHEEFVNRPNTTALNTMKLLEERRRAARHGHRVGRRSAPERRRHRRDLPTGEAPALGCEPERPAHRRGRDRRPVRGTADRPGSRQPQLGRLRPDPDRGARDHERLRARLAGRGLGRKRPRGRQLAVVPGVVPHVLTVGATDESDRVTVFSSVSPAMDIAAPRPGHLRGDPEAVQPERLPASRRHELLGAARLGSHGRDLDAAAHAHEHTALRGDAPVRTRRGQAGLGPGYRLRHPRSPRCARPTRPPPTCGSRTRTSTS